jgi:hypothetical protein
LNFFEFFWVFFNIGNNNIINTPEYNNNINITDNNNNINIPNKNIDFKILKEE